MKYFALALLCSFCFFACDIQKKEPTGIEKKKPLEEDENTGKQKSQSKQNNTLEHSFETNSKAEILNNIIVHERGGLKASRVYLAFEDGRLIPKNNKVRLGTPVLLVIVIDEGWTIENGIVSLDGSEKIFASTGELVLNAPNLFKASPEVKETDAKYINLKAVITRTRPEIDYFMVNYRIWDRKGGGEIKGSYKLYVDGGDE